jgi:hypothetical protein
VLKWASEGFARMTSCCIPLQRPLQRSAGPLQGHFLNKAAPRRRCVSHVAIHCDTHCDTLRRPDRRKPLSYFNGLRLEAVPRCRMSQSIATPIATLCDAPVGLPP